MKASYRWLRELVPQLTASPRELAARLTSAGLEVEAITEFGEASDSCVVVRVMAVRPHPTRSGLRLVTVDRGAGHETIEIVCGAPNVPEPGGLVVLAPLGAHLPAKNLTLAKRAIGGIESEGMLCSEEELGLCDAGSDKDREEAGILVLDANAAAPGTPLSAAIADARDTVLEIGLTPNRPDGLGHIGLAREICALYGFPFSLPEAARVATPVAAKGQLQDLVDIVVEAPDRCPHYGAAAVVDVRVASSPQMRYRLRALGVRSISNVVDVTNIVMLAWGHPMHAFDLDRVRGETTREKKRIVVRCARDGETLTTLDGVQRSLVSDDLVICDSEGPLALAGVMGGATSEIHAGSTRILFEVAWFEPRGVRRSARRHGMHTESSHRFERGVDPGDVAAVLDHAVQLTLASGGGAPVGGRMHVVNSRVLPSAPPPERARIRFRFSQLERVLGIAIDRDEATGIAVRLGCDVVAHDALSCELLLPSHRPDLLSEIDVVEEVIRVRGIDTIPASLPAIRASRDVGGREELARRVREVAVGLGLSEAMTYGFTSAEALASMRAPAPAVRLKNPLGEHHAVMRTSLLPGLLEAAARARRHGERDVRMFTVGAVFLTPTAETQGLPDEHFRVGVVLVGTRPAWLDKPQPVDVWDAKGFAMALAQRLAGAGVSIDVAALTGEEAARALPHLHPRGSAKLHVANVEVGTVGVLHPDVADAFELDAPACVLEIDLLPLAAQASRPRYVQIPRFPASTRDMAVVVSEAVLAGEVERAIAQAAGPLAEAVRLFDRFQGGQLPPGQCSLGFRVVYRSDERTLTDAEVDAAHASVVASVGKQFGATLRA